MSEDDDKTRIIGRRVSHSQDARNETDDEKTRIMRSSASVSADFATSAPTRIFSGDGSNVGAQPDSAAKEVAADQKTVLFRARSGAAAGEHPVTGDGNAFSPVVGWVVIIEGPGKGNSFNLGYGVNHIGRDQGQRVSLPYGDAGISREKHVSVVYDQKNRKFFIQQGHGSGLAYEQGDPVLQPVQLRGNERISLGSTTLVFIPFCNSDFDWEDA
jgi:hypothetical protein